MLWLALAAPALTWQAPDACPSEPELVTRIEALLGQPLASYDRTLEILTIGLSGCELTATVALLADDEVGSGSESESGSTDESTSDTSTSTDDATTFGDSSSTGDDACMFDPGDDACEICMADFCCMQLMFCGQSFSCQCMLECLPEQAPPDCAMQCQPGFEYFALAQCREAACNAVC